MVVLAALSGWFVRGIRFDADPDPSPSPRPTPPIVQSTVDQEPVHVIRRLPIDVDSRGNRNLFAYRVREQSVITHRMMNLEPMMVVAAPAEPVAAPAPAPLPFPYRYIGTFGPPHNSVAAFSRDGEVLTVRTGERVGDFVLRRIGIESVEVESTDGTRLIPLSSGQ